MAIKTQANDASIEKFLSTLDDSQRRDSQALIEIMQNVSGQPPVMWGSSIIGFGSYHYKSKSGQEGDWMKIGFSPRKGKLSLYITGDASQFQTELNEIGKHKIGKGCIYLTSLEGADMDKLKALIKQAYQLQNPYEVSK